MPAPSTGIDPGTVAVLIGIIVVTVQVLGRVIDRLLSLVSKNRQGNPSTKLNGTLEKISDRMVELVITQKALSTDQSQITKSLDTLNERFEKGLDSLGSRMEKRLDQFEKHLPE